MTRSHGHSLTLLDRNRRQLSRVIFTGCLPLLVHYSVISRLLQNHTTARFSVPSIEYANVLARHESEKGQPKPLSSRREVWVFMYKTGHFIHVAFAKTD